MIIVLDNLRIHHAKKLSYLYYTRFKPMFLPAYSSELNPIERLWSLLKRRWHGKLQLHVEDLQHVRDTRSQDQLQKATETKLRETIGKYYILSVKIISFRCDR